MSTVGIFTIVKNEHLFLDEWIQYHLNLGVDKIFVFEDVGSLSHEEICNKYDKVQLFKITDIYNKVIASNIVHKRKIKSSRYGIQLKFMYDIIEYVHKQKCLDWLIYIDADEFITLEKNDTCIKNIFDSYNDYAIVVLRWKNYNADGHIYRPNGNVLDNYNAPCDKISGLSTCSTASKLAFNLHAWNKNIIKCTFHTPNISSNCFKWCKTDYTTNLGSPTYKNVYIRHYITKSFEDYCTKIFVRGQFNKSMTITRFFALNPDLSRDDKDIVNILNSYYEKFMNGELDFTVW
jgi:hypothetical protein